MSVTISGSGQIVKQIIQATLLTKFTTTSTVPTFANTGLSVSITPTTSANKILVMIDSRGASSSSSGVLFSLLRNGSTVTAYQGTQNAGSQSITAGQIYQSDPNSVSQISIIYLDSPATTSAVTYSLGIASYNGSTVQINRSQSDTNAGYTPVPASSITVMEVAYA